jgi:phage-related protein (TIGR01555 family)
VNHFAGLHAPPAGLKKIQTTPKFKVRPFEVTPRRADDNFTGTISNGNYQLFSGGNLANAMTGLGTFNRDKVMAGVYYDPLRITDPELQALFHGNDLASRIVQLRPYEMFRRGYEVVIPDDTEGEQNENAEVAQDLEDYAEKLKANRMLRDGMTFARLFGGGVTLIGADDGLDPSLPLNEDNIKSIKYLNNIDRRFLVARTYYDDPMQPNFGEVETYQVTNAFGKQTAAVIHESRLIRFDGAPVDILKRRQLAGWTLSVLQRVYDTLRQFDTSFQAVSNLMVDASQAVFSMKGLMDIITSDNAGVLGTRMAMVDYTRSSGRAVLVDADTEKFERTNTSFSGIPDVLDRLMQRLASCADMPVTILFGRSPAGMNATGDSDWQHFYDTISSEQKNTLEPALIRLYRLICLAKDGPTNGVEPDDIEIHFHALKEPTDKEQAELEYLVAQKDQIYFTIGALQPEQIALSRWRGGDFSMTTEIDVEQLEEALKNEMDFSMQEKQMRAEQGPQIPVPGEPDTQLIAKPGPQGKNAQTSATQR